jgi:hypothetical protein
MKSSQQKRYKKLSTISVTKQQGKQSSVNKIVIPNEVRDLGFCRGQGKVRGERKPNPRSLAPLGKTGLIR